MNDLLNSVDQIRTSVDASAVFAGGGLPNAPLSDQIQFSSILKSFVNTHQEALAAAEGPAKPFERPALSKTLDRNSNERSSDNHPSKFDGNRSEPSSEKIPVRELVERNKPSDKPNQRAANSDGPQRQTPDERRPGLSDISEETRSQSPIDINRQGQEFNRIGTQPVISEVSNPQPRNPFFNNLGEIDTGRFPTENSNSRSLTGEINSKTASKIVSSALTDNDFTNIGEDLHRAVNKSIKSQATKTNSHSAADALVNRQAQDLSQKLGQSFQGQINVDIDNAAYRQKAASGQTITNNTLLAAQNSNGESANLLNSGQQRQGSNISPDRQFLNANRNSQNNTGANPNIAQQNSAQTNFAQTLQTQNLGAQYAVQSAQAANAAPKISPITADMANLTTVNGPAGPSQLSQTAKANPTTAARHPQKPPAPMEQVSVQIQKALSQGADKVNIKLHPAHLGRVEVRMDIGKDGQLSAIILAEKPETLELLQRDIRGLERALQQAGLDTNSNSFNFGLKNNGGQSTEPGRQRENDRGSSDKNEMENNSADPDDRSRNSQQYGQNQATDGGLDIRV